MSVLKECPRYEDCLDYHRKYSNPRNPFFRCDECNCYVCYQLGFFEGVRQSTKRGKEQ